MKAVMCFGDSITWGQHPVTRQRQPFDQRWPGRLQLMLGDRVRVIEEALCDRTTTLESPYVDGRNGKRMLGLLLESHAPLDLLVIMLGTNDLQRQFGRSAVDVALGVSALIVLAQQSGCGPAQRPPEVLVIAPPRFGNLAPLERLYFAGKESDAESLAGHLLTITDTYGCYFIDSSNVVTADCGDGIHLDAENHAKLAEAVYDKLNEVLGHDP